MNDNNKNSSHSNGDDK